MNVDVLIPYLVQQTVVAHQLIHVQPKMHQLHLSYKSKTLLFRVKWSNTVGNLGIEFGIVRDYFCSPSTSPHINQYPSPPSCSLGVGFPLPSNSHT